MDFPQPKLFGPQTGDVAAAASHARIDTFPPCAYARVRVPPETAADTENRVHAMTCSLTRAHGSPSTFDAMNLYVSNLSYTMTDVELQGVFAAFGTVSSARIVKDRETNRSRGFGFVEMPVESEALTAINELNGKEVGGRPLRVIEARPREERPPRNWGGGGGGGSGKRDPREGWDRDKRS